MPIIVDPVPETSPGGNELATVVKPGVPTIDGCPILTRLSAYVVSQGVPAVLEHTFVDRLGIALDLSSYLAAGAPQPGDGSVVLRVKEWLGTGPQANTNPIWEMTGTTEDPSAGVVQAALSADTVEQAGIYEASWAVRNAAGVPVLVNQSILSVERSLFPQSLELLYSNYGPPTLQEVRMAIMDSSANENQLLDDIEFKDEQILLALAAPVRYWNESPPPIETYTTRSFPFRGAWLSGVSAQLHLMAANNYRRNLLNHSAGGISVNDKAKEREYLAEGQRLWQEYQKWCVNKKVECNLKRFCGQAISQYSSRGW